MAHARRVSDVPMSNRTMTTLVEITMSWGSSVVQTASVCPPRTIHVGDRECPVPVEQLGATRLPFIVAPDGEPQLVVWPGTCATVVLRSEGVRPVDRIVAEGGASPCRLAPGLLTIPLPAGSVSEVVLPRRGAQSVYRDRACEDRVVLRVAVTRVPRRMFHRSLLLRYGAVASLALSLLAHFLVFATEPDPVLSPTLDEEPWSHEPSYSLRALTSALAEREPDGEWDRISAPLEDGACREEGGSRFDSIGITPSCASPVVIHEPERGGETEQYPDVPTELSSCFARPAPEQDWLGPPRVEIERSAGRARPSSDGRRRRSVPGGDLLGFLVVDDDDETPPIEVAEYGVELRAARSRRPRFAFGSPAVEVLERGLERAEPAFAWCYQRALQDHPKLSGRVAMRVAAPDGSGSVDRAGTDVEDVELQCCLANAQRLWTARVRGSGELRYVLDLRRAR